MNFTNYKGTKFCIYIIFIGMWLKNRCFCVWKIQKI